MQSINKSSVSKIFSHTWYIYPLSIIIIALIWLWAFQAYHQPSSHQKLELFFASDINDETFIKSILNKYDKEKCREINPSYCLPTKAGYTSKLQIAVNNADLLILDETTLKGFDGHDDNYFVEIKDDIKNEYIETTASYYSYEEHKYGVLLKESGVAHWLDKYMTFLEDSNYYICLSIASKNLGKITSVDNSYYDNALTIINYLLKE